MFPMFRHSVLVLLSAVGSSSCGSPPAPATPPTAEIPAATTPAAALSAPKPAEDTGTTCVAKTKTPEPVADLPGTVLANAQPSESDRLKPLATLIKSQRPAFRCCYDASTDATEKRTVDLRIGLDGKGTITSVSVQSPTQLAPPLRACIESVARALTYPASPGSKTTSYAHRFEFTPQPKPAQ